MGDSGRLAEYQGDERVWRIDHGGESAWVVAGRASEALAEHESISDDFCEDFTVKALSPTDSITVNGEDPQDFPEAFLEADDEFYDGGRIRFTANAAEWAEYVATTLKPKPRAFHLCSTEF